MAHTTAQALTTFVTSVAVTAPESIDLIECTAGHCNEDDSVFIIATTPTTAVRESPDQLANATIHIIKASDVFTAVRSVVSHTDKDCGVYIFHGRFDADSASQVGEALSGILEHMQGSVLSLAVEAAPEGTVH